VTRPTRDIMFFGKLKAVCEATVNKSCVSLRRAREARTSILARLERYRIVQALLCAQWLIHTELLGFIRPNRARRGTRLVWVNPRVIEYKVLGKHVKRGRFAFGQILDGDWDLCKYPVEELGIYQALAQHNYQRLPLKQTPHYYHKLRDNAYQLSESINEDRSLGYSCPRAKLSQKLDHWEGMLKSMRQHGYKTQRELGSYQIWHEIEVCIDRHGEILLRDGQHRLCAAKILELHSVPVRIRAVHRTWHDANRSIGKGDCSRPVNDPKDKSEESFRAEASSGG